jgi:protocatechuate 3,4-dioxygenase, alpha subunit
MEFVPSSSQTIGPFFHVYFDAKGATGCVASAKATGERIRLACRMFDGEGVPITDAMLELWQSDAAGIYNHPNDPRHSKADPAVLGFGRLPTNDDGVCEFETVKPGRVPGLNGVFQAPHFNITVFGRGLLKGLSTRIYFAGDSANQDDPILALVPQNRRDTLMARQDAQRPGLWSIDLRLCGDGETVFFDA